MLEKQPNGLVDIHVLQEQTEYLLSIEDPEEIEEHKELAIEVESALREHANLILERLKDEANSIFLFNKASLIRQKFLGSQDRWSQKKRIHYCGEFYDPIKVDSCDAIDEEAPFRIIGCISGSIFQCLFRKKMTVVNGIFVVASHDRDEEDSKTYFFGPPQDRFRKKSHRTIRSDYAIGHLLRSGIDAGIVSPKGQIHICETFEDSKGYLDEGRLTFNPELRIPYDPQSLLCCRPEAISAYVKDAFLDRVEKLERLKKDELLSSMREALLKRGGF
ncbi:hypothetical protein ACFL3T_03020 [Patescibacteria group bacterium]